MKPHRLLILIAISLLFSLSSTDAMAAKQVPKFNPTTKEIPSVPTNTVSKPPAIIIITGYCCDDTVIFRSTKAECNKARGRFFSREQDAREKCTGYCCRNGKITNTTSASCSNKRDKFYKTEAEALKQCQGYCCIELEVTKTTEQQCNSSRGRFFGGESQAYKYCDQQKGYCCKDGKVSRKNRAECSKKGEQFFTNSILAKKSCRVKKGYCNDGNRTLRLTEDGCKKKNGSYFTSQILASRELLQIRRQKVSTSKKSRQTREISKKVDEDDGIRATVENSAMAQRFRYNPFGFIHPNPNGIEIFSSSTPSFSWHPHPAAQKYFIRIMKTVGGAGSHRTIWSKSGIAGTGVTYNSDGSATEALVPGTRYRANLYARLTSHSGTPDSDPADYLQMTGDVLFSITPSVSRKGRSTLLGKKDMPGGLSLQLSEETALRHRVAPMASNQLQHLAQPNLQVTKAYIMNNNVYLTLGNSGGRALLETEYDRASFIHIDVEPLKYNPRKPSKEPGGQSPRITGKRLSFTNAIEQDEFTTKPPWQHGIDTGIPWFQLCREISSDCDDNPDQLIQAIEEDIEVTIHHQWGQGSTKQLRIGLLGINPLAMTLLAADSDDQKMATDLKIGPDAKKRAVAQTEVIVPGGKLGKSLPALRINPADIPAVAVPTKNMGVLKSYSRGVTITAPTPGDSYIPGDTIPVRFDFDETYGNPVGGILQLLDRTMSPPDQNSGSFTLTERSLGPWGNGSAVPLGVSQLQVPLDTASGVHGIRVILYDQDGNSFAAGWTDSFEIRADNIRQGIRVRQPAAGLTLYPGNELPVDFRYTDGHSAADEDSLAISLYNNSSLNYALAFNQDPEETSPRFIVPMVNATDNTFRVRVEGNSTDGNRIFGISDMFTISVDEPTTGIIPPGDSINPETETFIVQTDVEQIDEESKRIRVIVRKGDGGAIPPLRRIRLLNGDQTIYQQVWSQGTGPTSGSRQKIEWYIDASSDWPAGGGYQVEVVTSGLAGPYGISNEFVIFESSEGTEDMAYVNSWYVDMMAAANTSTECNGDNIHIAVHTDERNSVNLADQSITVTWTPYASCDPGADPYARSVAIYLHRADNANFANYPQLLYIPVEELQPNQSITRTFPLPDADRNVDYVVSIQDLLQNNIHSGHSRPFRFRFSERDFHVFVPHDGLFVIRNNNPPDISWTIPPELDNGSSNIEATFRVELLGGSGRPLQIYQGQVRYDIASKLCSIPWRIGTEIRDGANYQIKVTAIPTSAYAEGNYTATMYGKFEIGARIGGPTYEHNPGDSDVIWVTPIEPGQEYAISQVVHLRWNRHLTTDDSIHLYNNEGGLPVDRLDLRHPGTELDWKVGSNIPPGFYRICIPGGCSQSFRIYEPVVYTWSAVDRPAREKIDVSWSQLPPGCEVDIWGTKTYYCSVPLNAGDDDWHFCGGISYDNSANNSPYRSIRETRPFRMVRGIDGASGSYSVNYDDCIDVGCEGREGSDLKRILVRLPGESAPGLNMLDDWVDVN